MTRAYLEFMGRVWSMPSTLLLEILEGDGVVPDLEADPRVRLLKGRSRSARIVSISSDGGHRD